MSGPADTAAFIDWLRADGVVLTYDPHDRTLRTDGHDRCPSPSAKTTDSGTRDKEARPARRKE
jgi:hypothetical protein